MNATGVPQTFSYEEAFDRNVGWVTEWEQQVLRRKRVAIAGMGGVGGVHLLTLARLGIGRFHIADFDAFEQANFNRQAGASTGTLGRSKVEVMGEMARGINPELDIATWPDGVTGGNLDAFLDGADLFVDGLDFFAIDERRKVFARCDARGIPVVTAGPIGLGVAYLIFMPGRMSFEEYFRLDGLPKDRQYVNFLMGVVPRPQHRPYLVDPRRVDLAGQRGPSLGAACQLCAGVVGIEALKILLQRDPIRAAPHYHLFDAYRGKWVHGRLIGGNRNPVQRAKLAIAYRIYDKLSKASKPPAEPRAESEIEQILELARWAPSGDNAQPWRFAIKGPDRLTVSLRIETDDVYEYNGAQPSLLSAGMLLESMRIAASAKGRGLWWSEAGGGDQSRLIDVEFPKVPGLRPDPLLSLLPHRSVDRGPYRRIPLTPEQKAVLEATLGDQLEIRWFESDAERARIARLNGAATDIRLRIPEAYRIHQTVLDWERTHCESGVPVRAIGLDAPTLAIMRWAMKRWSRMELLNRLPGGTFSARLQMDYRPGRASAAHFLIARKTQPVVGQETAALLGAGKALQRFWLTACGMGLALQPSLAPLCFAHYGRHDTAFTADPGIRAKALALASRVAEIAPTGAGGEELLFLARIGVPRGRGLRPRSTRLPLDALIVSREGLVEAEIAEAAETAPFPAVAAAGGD